MGPDVHRDPERLRAHAREARDLAETLESALRGRADHVLPTTADAAVLDRLVTVVGHAVQELAELAAVLTVAATVDDADSAALAALRRALSS